MSDCVLVLDIGKTNKKVLLYDGSLAAVDHRAARIDEVSRYGMRCENVEAIIDFFLGCAAEFSRRHRVRGIAVSAHGATVCGLDARGAVLPVLSYTNDPGRQLHDEFYAAFGAPAALKRETGTPDFGDFLNTAKTIYYMKTRMPDAYGRMHRVLFYPQLFTFLLTGYLCADPTYAGNHNYLWDFRAGGWSRVAGELGVTGLLPGALLHPWEPAGVILPEVARRTGLPPDCVAAAGIHDSNSALLPYLLAGQDNFLLNSTGTWCVAMKPEDEFRFADDEIDRTVFFNLSPFMKPVKTAIFMGGHEYGWYTKELFSEGGSAPPPFDADAYRAIIENADSFILPPLVPGFGLFPGSAAAVVIGGRRTSVHELRSREERALAYRLLNLSLAVQSVLAFRFAGLGRGTAVYVEGGFLKNRDYLALLAALLPESEVRVSGMKEASAFGAALCALIAAGVLSMDGARKAIAPGYRAVERPHLGGTERYVGRFVEMAGDGS